MGTVIEVALTAMLKLAQVRKHQNKISERNDIRKRGSSVVRALASRAKGTGIDPSVGKGISLSVQLSFMSLQG